LFRKYGVATQVVVFRWLYLSKYWANR
jgi:hypothetical protein